MISLLKSVRSCIVSTGDANRMQSARFQDPSLMVCPMWIGQDQTGRVVCKPSYYTKSAGCNSATDRVYVENSLRPRYSELITLDTTGIDGGLYDDSLVTQNTRDANKWNEGRYKLTGNYGLDFKSKVISSCNYGYEQATQEQAMQEQASISRHNQQLKHLNTARVNGNMAGRNGCFSGCNCPSCLL